MCEIKQLDKNFLLELKRTLRRVKKRFYRGYHFYCQRVIPFHPFLEKYVLPLLNIKDKLQCFEEYFAEYDLDFPKLPDFEEMRYAEYWYTNDPIVQDLKYKDEILGFEYDNYTDSLSEDVLVREN